MVSFCKTEGKFLEVYYHYGMFSYSVVLYVNRPRTDWSSDTGDYQPAFLSWRFRSFTLVPSLIWPTQICIHLFLYIFFVWAQMMEIVGFRTQEDCKTESKARFKHCSMMIILIMWSYIYVLWWHTRIMVLSFEPIAAACVYP